MTAIKIGDAIAIKVGSTNVLKVMYGGRQVWPMAYECTLAPESWTFGGQYLITAIPAAGGYASPTRWVFTIKNPATHETIHTIYLSSLVTAPTIEEYIGGVWVAAQNFRFTNNQWQADDRGTNGYGSSGSDAPQSEPARQSRMTASYTTTYNNVQCSATYTGTMVQNGNNAVAGTGYFDDPVVSLDRYDSTSDKAPAYKVTTTLFATADFVTPYTFVDAVTGATNPATYTRIQTDAAQTDDFTFSGPSWVTIGTPSSQGATVTIESRGTDYDTMFRYDRIRATRIGSSDYDDVYVYQSENVFINTQKDYSEAWAETFALDGTIPATATSFTIYGTFHFKSRRQYSSLAWSAWDWDYDDATVAITSVSPSSGVSVSGNVVTIPQNTGYTDIEYETVSRVTYDGQTKTGITASVTQEGVAQVVTFANPVITQFEYIDLDGYNIPASGGTVYPSMIIEQDYYINGVYAGTLSDAFDDGTNSGTMTAGDVSSDYTVHYYVNNAASENGAVSANSRGTTPGDTRNVATNCYAYVTAADKNSSQTAKQTVTQQYNQPESTEEFNQTYSVVDLGFEWESHNAKALSAGETGYLTWASCKEYYYIRTYYTSEDHSDGTTQYDRDIDAEASESSSWLSASGYYVTASKNGKSGGERSATVYAEYDGHRIGSVTVTQAETLSWYSLESSSEVGLTFTAAGGSKTVTFTGYHRYDNGDSPTETSSPGVTVTYDGDVSGRISNGGTQGRTITASNLGSDPYDEVDTYYTYQWTLHSEATCDIPVTQGPNEPGNFGTVNFPDPGSTADAGGDTIHLAPTCPFTWTSGASGTMLSDGFDYEYVTKGNSGYRTYDFEDDYAVFGSLGTSTRNRVNTTIRARLKADSSKTDTAVIQEEPNGPTNNHELAISWSNPVTIPGYGGSINVGIVTAKYKTQYDSLEWDSGETVAPATIAASIQISGSGFTKSYTSGNSYITISAPYNPDSSAARYCDVTAYYGGESDTTSVTQKKCPFDTDYRETTESGQRIRTAYIINTDDERHRYEYTRETAVGGVVDTVTGTTSTLNSGAEQNMGAVPLISGQTNTISVDVDAVQYYSGGRWVSHQVIR